MYQLYKEIVKQLEPYKDKVFFQPLKKNELALLENNIGQHFPEYYRQFLLSFGMQQDFVYELIKQEQDFVAAYSYLPESVAAFPDGDDFVNLMTKVGFKGAKDRRLTFGVSAIYTGLK